MGSGLETIMVTLPQVSLRGLVLLPYRIGKLALLEWRQKFSPSLDPPMARSGVPFCGFYQSKNHWILFMGGRSGFPQQAIESVEFRDICPAHTSMLWYYEV